MSQRLNRWVGAHHGWLIVALMVCVYGTSLLVTRGLTHPVRADEEHFWATTRDYFLQPLPPSTESLREYPELITPLSYIVWGQLDLLTGDGILAGRFLNLLMSAAILLLLAHPRGQPAMAGLGAALGLLAYPYFLALGTRLYTDMIGAFFVVFALHLHLRGRLWQSSLLFMLAIATRQYLVQIPAALVLWEAWRWKRGEEGSRLLQVVAPAAAGATLLGWFAFWDGLAPQPGLDRWIPKYPAPMLSPFAFILHYGLYFLTILGAYFALVEALVFRELPPRTRWMRPWVACLGLGLAVAFWLDPPLLSDRSPGGAFGRVVRPVLSGEVGDVLRMVLYWALAFFASVRLVLAGGLPLLVGLVGVIMSMKSQVPWEKYLFPCLLPLWYLRSRPDRPGGMSSAAEPRSG